MAQRKSSIVIGMQPRAPLHRQPDSPRARFVRIGPERVGKAAKAIRLLQQFANPAVYDVKPRDREKIVGALTQEIEQLDYALAHPGKAAPIVTFEDE